MLAVGGTYLQAVASAARVQSQEAQVANAQAVYNQAVVRKTAGVNSKIDVMRSLVELQTQKQRLSSLSADFDKQKISLARVIGVSEDREIGFVEPLHYEEVAIPETARAISQAESRRADLQAMSVQVRAAQIALWPHTPNGFLLPLSTAITACSAQIRPTRTGCLQ